ncbi:hypothetical protein MLD38_025156 [Melastoma candidum]|uniref:Uncharacterized protein n=1 Tax=Melastoma candidum TaxID=119954 RepID=A0ACB9NZM9_9MYRT|nr:hypothetical protein MLD38_025156 [Melastoma candidum]
MLAKKLVQSCRGALWSVGGYMIAGWISKASGHWVWALWLPLLHLEYPRLLFWPQVFSPTPKPGEDGFVSPGQWLHGEARPGRTEAKREAVMGRLRIAVFGSVYLYRNKDKSKQTKGSGSTQRGGDWELVDLSRERAVEEAGVLEPRSLGRELRLTREIARGNLLEKAIILSKARPLNGLDPWMLSTGFQDCEGLDSIRLFIHFFSSYTGGSSRSRYSLLLLCILGGSSCSRYSSHYLIRLLGSFRLVLKNDMTKLEMPGTRQQIALNHHVGVPAVAALAVVDVVAGLLRRRPELRGLELLKQL